MIVRARSFGAAADAYARARPSYPEEAVRFVLPALPCRVADVGAGTGKLTEVLVRLGCEAVAVEPDAEMRARIRGVEALQGEAEALPLRDASVDAVVAGQAFHWFDAERFADEAVRVLRRGGTVGLLWNELDDRVDWVAELASVAGSSGRMRETEPAAPFADGRFEPAALREVEHVQRLDAFLLAAQVASRSHTIALPQGRREALLAAVERFARDRFGGGTFELPYVTRAWRLALRDAPGAAGSDPAATT